MASAFAVAAPASPVRETPALSSSTKQKNLADTTESVGTRFNYRSYGAPAINRAVAQSLGAEYLPDVNMVKMRVA